MSQPITTLDSYRLLGRSGLRVSPLCLGGMTFGTEWGWGSERQAVMAICERYVERGGNFFDTANFYTHGTSEQLLGEFIRTERERYVVATKYTLKMRDGDPNSAGNHHKNMVRAIEGSLRRLNTDYIDLYYVHAWDFTTPTDELMRGLDDLVSQGKVCYLGISDTPAWKIAELNTYAEQQGLRRFIAAQMPYSLVRRDIEREILPACRALGLGLLPWSPLGSGVLSGKYSAEDLKRERELISSGKAKVFGVEKRLVGLSEKNLEIASAVTGIAESIGRSPAQVALNWLLSKRGISSIIVGARTLEQLNDNLGCLDFTLGESELSELEKASKIELGFPHDFLNGGSVSNLLTAGAKIERCMP